MYYEPSDIWCFYGIKTRNEYVEKYVIKGNFHNEVPEDIKKSYETVEYLMAHAYYHWPMYDEALKKILGIYEMGIKLKCQVLGITIEVKDKNGKTKKKDLAILIDQLIKKKGYPKELKNKLQGTRELRNMLAHPDSHSFMGALNISAIIRTVNIINELFLEENWYALKQNKFTRLKKESLTLKEILFVLNYKNERILVCDLVPIATFKVKDKWVHCWSFSRLINDISNLDYNNIPAPIIMFLTDVEIENNCLSAVDFKTSNSFSVEQTINPLNIEKFDNHKKGISLLTEKDKHVYTFSQLSSGDNLIEEFIHENCWS